MAGFWMKSLRTEIDAIDRRILEELRKDGRMAIIDLAAKVGLSPTPCQRRLKRLEESGVIAGYAAILNPAAVGRGLQAFVQVALADHKEETVASFQRAIAARPEVAACYIMSGELDYLLHVAVADLEAYSEFALKTLLHIPGVKDTRSSLAMSVLKPFTQPALRWA
jgi:Lrp/AsnC family leucine-responsive transcriptional regulator